jgi:hypothetical protein
MFNQRGDSMDLNSIFNDAANRVNGLRIVSHTLVGCNPSNPFPRKSGNCFTMRVVRIGHQRVSWD